jgi:hypothetical protein
MDFMVVRSLLGKALKEAYPTLDSDCTLTNKEGNTFLRKIKAPSLSRTSGQHTCMLVIHQLEPNLVTALQEMQIFANATFAFVVVNPALDAVVLQYLGAVLDLVFGKVKQKELVESVKSHVRDNDKVKHIVQQDYQACYQKPVPASYLKKTLATLDNAREQWSRTQLSTLASPPMTSTSMPLAQLAQCSTNTT